MVTYSADYITNNQWSFACWTHQSTSLAFWHEGLIKAPPFQDVEGGLPWAVWTGLLPGERGRVWSSPHLLLLLQLHPADAVSAAAE